MGTDHFMWSSSGNLAFECDHGILGDSPDRAGGTISSAFAGADGAFFGRVYQNLFLPARYCSDSNGLYSSDRQLLYSLSVRFSDECFLWLYTVAAQFSIWASGDCVHAGLLMSSLRRSVVIFSIIILGCGLESYINPVILKIVLKNFF